MPWTWNACDTCWLESTSTLARMTLPSVSPTTLSRIGPRVLHGPHHSAQRSTTTGISLDRSTTSAGKVASVTSIDMGGNLPAAVPSPTWRRDADEDGEQWPTAPRA